MSHKNWSQNITGYHDFRHNEEFIAATLFCHQCNFENRMIMEVENCEDMEVPSVTWYTDHEKQYYREQTIQRKRREEISKMIDNAKRSNHEIDRVRKNLLNGVISEGRAKMEIQAYLSGKMKPRVSFPSESDSTESGPLTESERTRLIGKVSRAMERAKASRNSKEEENIRCKKWLEENPFRYEKYVKVGKVFMSNMRNKTREQCIQEVTDHMPYSDAEEFETEVDAYMKDCELHHEQQVLRENHVYFNTEVVSYSPSGVADRTVLDVLSRNARDKSEIEFCKFLENPNSERILHNWKIMDDLSRRYDKPYHDWMNQNKSRIMASIQKRDFQVCVVDEVANDSDKDTIGTDDELPAEVVVKLNAVRDTLLATEVASLTKMSLLTDNVWTLSHLERRIPEPQKITPHQYYIIKRLDILSPEAIMSYEDIMRDRLNKGDRNMVKSVDVFQKATGFNLTTGPVKTNVLPPLSSKAHAMADNIVKIPENVDLESTIGKLTSDSDKKFSALETQISQLANFVQTNATQVNKALEDLKENRNKSTFLRGTVQDARYIPHGNPGLNQNGPMNANIGQLNSPVDALFDTPKSQGVKVDYKLGYYSAAMDPAIQARRDNADFTEGEMKQELERPPFMNRREMFHTKDRAIPKFKKDKNPIEWFEDFLKYGWETGRGMAEMLYTTLSLCFDGDEKVWFKVNKAKWNILEDFRVDLFSTFASGTEFHKKRIQVMELEQTFEEDPIMFATGKWENFKLYHPEMSKEMRIMTIIKLLNPRYSGLLINCRFPSTDTGFYQLEEQLKQAREIVTKNKDYMDKL